MAHSPLSKHFLWVSEEHDKLLCEGLGCAVIRFKVLEAVLCASDFVVCRVLVRGQVGRCHTLASGEDVDIVVADVEQVGGVARALVNDSIIGVVSVEHHVVLRGDHPRYLFLQIAARVVI